MEQTKQEKQYKYQLKLIFGGIQIDFFIIFVFFVYITNTLRTTTTSSQTDSWLIVVITFTIVNLVISAINFYKQCKMDKQKKEPIPPIVEYTVGEGEEEDTLV
jgi:uncharacterized membrane protein YidH (DUF202 family)